MNLSQEDKAYLWSTLPIGRENAVSYFWLCSEWEMNERKVRAVLHELSLYDDGDGLVLIRSSKDGGGFYRTADPDELAAYRRECLAKGRSIFAPIHKINKILKADAEALQLTVLNNLRAFRLAKNLTQPQVIEALGDSDIDRQMLSKFENGNCIPTPAQLAKLARIYETSPSDLLSVDQEGLAVYAGAN